MIHQTLFSGHSIQIWIPSYESVDEFLMGVGMYGGYKHGSVSVSNKPAIEIVIQIHNGRNNVHQRII